MLRGTVERVTKSTTMREESRWRVPTCDPGVYPAEPRPAADALQPPLVPRSSFQARLRPSVVLSRCAAVFLRSFAALFSLATRFPVPRWVAETHGNPHTSLAILTHSV